MRSFSSCLGTGGAYRDFVQRGDCRKALQKKNSADQFFLVLHLVDGAFFEVLVKLLIAPVIAHFGMDHVLVDSRQLVGQKPVEG